MRGKVAAAWYALAAALFVASAASAEPYRPQHDGVVLLRLAPSPRALPRVLTPESLVASAVQEMAQGRASLDERHFGRAEALLLRALPCVSRADDRVGAATAFAFGLLHGFGFASALDGLGAAKYSFATALAGFNLGVEAGQLIVVAATFPILIWLRGYPALAAWFLRVSSVLVASVGVFWVLERASV